MNNLTLHLKKLEKDEKNKYTISGRKQITKNRAEIKYRPEKQ